MIIEIYYPKLTEKDTYLKPGVLVEVGSRSLKDPFTDRTFTTMIAENYPGQPFADKPDYHSNRQSGTDFSGKDIPAT
ncbi:MAG: hypothetical protein MZV63_49000 [Marinilabiliales bacterium]|nr:hypothetical protein [Marinilabiliales bacterium]